MDQAIGVALIAGPLSGAATLLLTKMLGRRRDSVEVDALLADRWEKWSEHQDRRIARLEEEVRDLRGELSTAQQKNAAQASLMSSLIGWALQLRDEVLKLGGHPPAAPPEVQAALTSLEA